MIPSVTLSERYDSNVYFVPGSNLEDYVTTVSPQLRVVHRGQLVEGTVGGGLAAATYVKNSGLNYVATNAVINLNLDGAMGQLVRGLGLTISDTFRYTPELPAFAGPADGGEIPASAVIGIQAQRANSTANTGRVAASYAVSPRLSFTSTYLDRRLRFGNVNFCTNRRDTDPPHRLILPNYNLWTRSQGVPNRYRDAFSSIPKGYV